jgi:ketosteroid isomerase-like protein
MAERVRSGGTGEASTSAPSGMKVVDDIRRVFEAFAGGDPRALFEVIAGDAVWRVAGSAPIAREYRGRDDVFELFRATRRETGGSYRSELRWALADGDHAVAVYRARGRRLGRELDIDQVLVITLRDGCWSEIVALPTDPVAFEAFWAE